MSVSLHELVHYTDNLLQSARFDDYCPNGLQIEAATDVHRIVAGVTASQALIDAAIKSRADLLLVHHGYFWKGEGQALTGIKALRIKKLMQHGISLLAYHLPLDAHPLLGNNAQLARLLDFNVDGGLDDSELPVGLVGHLSHPQSLAGLGAHINQHLQREPLLIGDMNRQIKTLAWCTGAAQSYIGKAVAKGVDCFITGEASEPTFHIARENNICFIAAGHHATERYGVQALGEHLAAQYDLQYSFVDIANPV